MIILPDYLQPLIGLNFKETCVCDKTTRTDSNCELEKFHMSKHFNQKQHKITEMDLGCAFLKSNFVQSMVRDFDCA